MFYIISFLISNRLWKFDEIRLPVFRNPDCYLYQGIYIAQIYENPFIRFPLFC